MLTTGVDIIEIERIQRALERWGDRFLRRIYTEDEAAYCRGRPPNLAGRFAAKEAVRAETLGVREMSLSLSHSRNYAVAFVVGLIPEAE